MSAAENAMVANDILLVRGSHRDEPA
jgi:hypothetical protein